MDLKQKVVVVTGAGRGLGRGIATYFAGKGARLACVDLSQEDLDATVAACEAAGGEARAYLANVAKEEEVEKLFNDVVADFGTLHGVVNNAGITRDNLFMRMSDDEWNSVLNVNLTATFKLCKGVMRGMMKARWGRIINISSVVGATGNPGQANYAASKAGVVGMSKSLAYEVASRGITVNAVAPGFITTAMTDKLTDEQKSGIMGQIPAGRMGDPDEIAAAVVYLSSAEAAYVTGTTLHVNGGMAML